MLKTDECHCTRGIRSYCRFRRHLDGRQSGQKLLFVWDSDCKYLTLKLNFTQFVNQNVTILGRRLFSPGLKDVAWLEDPQFNFF